MNCPKCLSKEYVKSGFMRGNQRHLCKECGCNFTRSHYRNASMEIKLQALKLYWEGMGFRAIGRILGFSNVVILIVDKKFCGDNGVSHLKR